MPPEIDIADKMATGFDFAYYIRHGEKIPHIGIGQYIASFTTRFQNLQELCAETAGKQSWQLQN